MANLQIFLWRLRYLLLNLLKCMCHWVEIFRCKNRSLYQIFKEIEPKIQI